MKHRTTKYNDLMIKENFLTQEKNKNKNGVIIIKTLYNTKYSSNKTKILESRNYREDKQH